MSRKTFIIIGIILIVIVAIVLWLLTRPVSPPYYFPDEKLTVRYLSEQTQLGEYILISKLNPNPVKQADGSYAAFYSLDGKVKKNNSETIVAVGSGSIGIDKMLSRISKEECVSKSKERGEYEEQRFFKGHCGSFHYYIFQNEKGNWISFSTPDGNEALTSILTSYYL